MRRSAAGSPARSLTLWRERGHSRGGLDHMSWKRLVVDGWRKRRWRSLSAVASQQRTSQMESFSPRTIQAIATALRPSLATCLVYCLGRRNPHSVVKQPGAGSRNRAISRRSLRHHYRSPACRNDLGSLSGFVRRILGFQARQCGLGHDPPATRKFHAFPRPPTPLARSRDAGQCSRRLSSRLARRQSKSQACPELGSISNRSPY